jgi:hypothetical protein
VPIDIVQSNAGGFNATGTQTVTLGAGVAADSQVVICAFGYGGGSMNTPTGFVRAAPAAGPGSSQKTYIFRRGPLEGLTAAESSWNVSETLAMPFAWRVYELSGVDNTADPLDALSTHTTATAATASTGTSGTTTAYDALVIGVLGARDAASGTGPTWSGWTNSFVEDGESAQAIAGGASSVGMAVAFKSLASIGTVESTATHSLSPTTAPVGGVVAVLAAAGSKRAASIVAHTGFEFGTAAGLTTGLAAGSVLFDAMAGSPAVVATNPRTGSYCLELSASAATEYLEWATETVGVKATLVVRVSVLFPGSLPPGDVIVAQVGGGLPAGDTLLRFRAASSKLGVQVGTGTEQLSATTVAADTWYDLDLRAITSGSAAATIDWQLDGVDQTQAVGAAAGGASWVGVFVGWTVAATATVRYDDLAVSDIGGNYPIGDIRVHLLKVDPAGTVAVSGSSSNFGVMTANGTIGAWDATGARNAVDEVPPTIGAASDGAVAVTARATDYIEFPMETYDASGSASIRAVRVLLAIWAASGTAATCRVLGYDGTAATTLFAEADPNADNSTTTTAWIAKTFKPAGGWTQAKLDALAVRYGSNDATPDNGPIVVYAEVVIQPAAAAERVATVQLVEGRDDLQATVDARLDPVSGGAITYDATVPADGGDAVVDYLIDGTPSSATVTAGSVDTEVVDAPDGTTVTQVGIRPAAGAPDI